MFETFERRYPGDSVGMYWALSGPKTEKTLPDDTVVLFDGYITDENEKSLPLMVSLDNAEENSGEVVSNGEL